jgi:hypothetical protein
MAYRSLYEVAVQLRLAVVVARVVGSTGRTTPLAAAIDRSDGQDGRLG